jgi:hypothetical protein
MPCAFVNVLIGPDRIDLELTAAPLQAPAASGAE